MLFKTRTGAQARTHQEMTMSETPLPPRRTPEFEGRDALDRAWASFRKASADLLRESARASAVPAAHAAITKEAAATLSRLAAQARRATAESRAKRQVTAEVRLRRSLRRVAGQGSAKAAEILERLDREEQGRAQG